MEYATRHLYFPYTHEPLGECVCEENTIGKWHVPRYLTRKHCITTLSHMPKSSENLWEFSKTSEMLQTRF